MSRFHSYLRSASNILSAYTGTEPLASFLKKYFAQHKKFGSSDRRSVAHLCYCCFRSGKAFQHLPAEQRIILSLFLCSASPNPVLAALDPALNDKLPLSIAEKMQITGINAENIFPWQNELSDGISFPGFTSSFFIQPDVFLRIRPGFREVVLHKLSDAGIQHTSLSDAAIALPNTTKADAFLWINKEAVIQDLSSQRIAAFLRQLPATNHPLKVWDCCAASGGKSILANDILGTVDLTVSDIRPSMLANLKKRFTDAGIRQYKSFTADLTQAHQLPSEKFHLVIADVPCSGSGTWGRTPEQLFYYDISKTNEFASLQQQIIRQVLTTINKGGYLLYITCSVFKKENEDMITWLRQQYNMQVLRSQLLTGYTEKADTMYAALLQMPL